MSSGQLFPERETLFKKPLLYIRWVAGDGYVRGLSIIGHVDVIVAEITRGEMRWVECSTEFASVSAAGALGFKT
jgi:hypothetical protein